MGEIPSPALRGDLDVTRRFNVHLHGARGMFAMMIVLFHVINSRLPTLAFLHDGVGLFLARSLEHGVELFFGISGIVIVGALRRAAGPHTFAIDRATRIYPVLWVAVCALVALEAMTRHQGFVAPSAATFVANLLALPPLAPFPLLHPAAWSLSYEMAFYLFCAAAWWLGRVGGRMSLLLIVPLAAWLLIFHFRALLMPIGMLVAWTAPRQRTILAKLTVSGAPLLVFLLLWEVVCERTGGDLINLPPQALLGQPMLLLATAFACVAAAVAFAGILEGKGALCAVLAHSSFQWLGTISYSLYLWHPMVMSVVKSAMISHGVVQRAGPFSQLIFLTLALPPSLALAALSAWLLEQRTTGWIRRKLVSANAAKATRHTLDDGAAARAYPESLA